MHPMKWSPDIEQTPLLCNIRHIFQELDIPGQLSYDCVPFANET